MARYTGKDLYVAFTPDGGTLVDLSGDYRELSVEEEANLADVTAGNDTHENSVATTNKGSAKLSMLDESGSSGSTIRAAIKQGTKGTLEWGPEGHSTGDVKMSATAIVKKRSLKYPYDDAVELEAEFELQDDVTEGTYA